MVFPTLDQPLIRLVKEATGGERTRKSFLQMRCITGQTGNLRKLFMPGMLPREIANCKRHGRAPLPRLAAQHFHLLALLMLGMMILPVAIPAATFVWDGHGSGNSLWRRARNWVGNAAPPANAFAGLFNTDIILSGATKTTPVLDRRYYIHSLTFASDAASFTLDYRGNINNRNLLLGAGGITNNSANLQTLRPSITISQNQTWQANAGDLTARGPLNLPGNNLTFSGSFHTTVTGPIQGTGSLTKDGLGTLTLGGSAANTFSGGVTINAGTVHVGKASALGSGPLTVNGGTLNVGNYNLLVGDLTLSGGTLVGTGGSIAGSSDYQLQAGTVAGNLSGPVAALKTTGGTVFLTAASSYTGGTQVSAGSLIVNNVSGSGTGSGPVTINASGAVMGIGAIGGAVTNGPGGLLSAGYEIGTLNIGNLVWFGGGVNRWDLSDAASVAGSGWDLLRVNGTLTLWASPANKAIIDVTSFTLAETRGLAANFDPTQNYLWTILETTGGIFFSGGGDAGSVFNVVTGNFNNPHDGGEFAVQLSDDGRQLHLTYTYIAVPEPSKIALLGLGLFGFVYLKRVQRNWPT